MRERVPRALLRPYYSLKIRIAMPVIDGLDDAMTKVGWNRARRRRFWREFAHRNRGVIKDALELL